MKHYSLLIVICLILWRSSTGQGHPCSYKFHELMKGMKLEHCQRLPTLGAELGWSDPKKSEVVKVVFGAPLVEEKGWLAWGVNPGPHAQMVGTRAAIGIKDPVKGLSCHTYNVTYETRIGCRLNHSVLDEIKCTEFLYDDSMQYHLIMANLNISSKNVSKLNIVWQIGRDADGDVPKKHVATLKNVDSVETLDLYTGKSSGLAHVKVNLRKVHGVLNIVGWGTLLPIGVIIARYFRKFPFESEWWFYFHVSCQSTGFLIGVVGWGIGMWLAHNSPRYVFYSHHAFAIFIFVFATLQTLAIRFRPSREDDFRRVWNIYHHFLGYTLLALIFINIFKGIRLLKPDTENWRLAVIGILVALGTITLILECYTWKKFIDIKRNSGDTSSGTAKSGAGEQVPRGAQSSPSHENIFDDKNKRSKSESLPAGPAQPGGGDPRGAQSCFSQPVNLPAGPVQPGGGDPRGAQSSFSQPVNLPAGPVQAGGGDPRGAQSSFSQPNIVADVKNKRSKSLNLPAGSVQAGGGDPRGPRSAFPQPIIATSPASKI